MFAAGQLALSTYQVVLAVPTPLPSIGDPLFFVGYLMMIASTVVFINTYRATGFPIGSDRQLLAIAVGAAAVFTVIGIPLLTPVAMAEDSLGKAIVNVGYPVLDFVALVPNLVLLRITFAFRGGRIWTVWAAILAGFVCFGAADILFSYLTSIGHDELARFIDSPSCWVTSSSRGAPRCSSSSRLRRRVSNARPSGGPRSEQVVTKNAAASRSRRLSRDGFPRNTRVSLHDGRTTGSATAASSIAAISAISARS